MKAIDKLTLWVLSSLVLAIAIIFLGGACWAALIIWKAVFAFFA